MLELRHYPYKLKNKAQSSCNDYSVELERANQQLRRYDDSIRAGNLAGMSHAERVGRMSANDQRTYQSQRETILTASSVVRESDQSLTRTQQILIETEEVGAATHAQLERQREQFHNQINTVHETDDFLSKSKRTLERMHRRLVTNKLLQGAIILVELGACGLIVYLRYYK